MHQVALQPGLQATPPIDATAQNDDAFLQQFGFQPSSAGVSPPPVTNETFSVTQSSDIVGGLQQSSAGDLLGVQRRSAVSLDPHIRGYKYNQIYSVANGVYWQPARTDLDTMLDKIDSWLVEQVTVIPGPFRVRHGPGFSFIDVQTVETPRYEGGFQAGNRMGFTVNTNGGQAYARETFFGGNEFMGFVFSYGHRTGSDYETGKGTPISTVPSSYKNRNFTGQFGINVGDKGRVELNYQRLDQTDTEYAAQLFDVNLLVSENFSVSYIVPMMVFDGETRIDAWYNRTRFTGDTRRPGKRNPFPVIDRIVQALVDATAMGDPVPTDFIGDTNGDIVSTGGRWAKVHGDTEDAYFTYGADLRIVRQNIKEALNVIDATNTSITGFPVNTGLADSQRVDPGAFIEFSALWNDSTTLSMGGRVDWVHTDANPRSGSALPGTPGDVSQDDVLMAFFWKNEIQLGEVFGVSMGIGHAQRTPSLTERYADGLFLGIVQNGFSRVIGNPSLRKERAWQVDLGLSWQTEISQGYARAFHSWVTDYVTYRANSIPDPTGAQILFALNTDHATLTGMEVSHEVLLTSGTSIFGSARYVDGRDREIDAALPQIAPLEARLGLRLNDGSEQSPWTAEFGARMVASQDRIGVFRTGQPGSGTFAAVEERTGGFTVFYLRSTYALNDSVYIVSGINNLFDRSYIEHLDLRLPDDHDGTKFLNTKVFSPGISPFFAVEITR